MPPILIDRLDDPRLDVFGNLKAPRDPRFRSLFVVEGLLVTERLPASRLEVAAVVCGPCFSDRLAAAPAGIFLYAYRSGRMEGRRGRESFSAND